MQAHDLLPEVRKRGALRLADLEEWVRDTAKYERELPSLARSIVRHRIALFPEEAANASVFRTAIPGGDVPPSDLYGVYLQEIRRIPPMERLEELRYALALEITKRALELEVNRPRPSAKEIDAMEAAVGSRDATFRRMIEEARKHRATASPSDAAMRDREARVRQRFDEMLAWKKALVFRVLPLVPGMARKYRGMGVGSLDLIQEANSSLLKATDRYEWRKGVRFVVYARWWVQQGILKSLSSQSRTVRTPVYMAQKLKKIRDMNDRSMTSTGHKMTTEAIGAALDEPAKRVERALAAAKMTVSIDRAIDPNGEFSLRDVLVAPNTEIQIDDRPAGPPLSSRIDQLLDGLNDREKLILELRYGLHEHAPETLESVSHRLGVSRERIRQIQDQALRKLQNPSKRMKLASFLPS